MQRNAKTGRSVILLLLWSVLLTAGSYQRPLFSANQNQKFLRGLADSRYGELDRDWLARTTDPTPLFTALVRFTVAGLGSWCFYVEQLFLFVAYLGGMIATYGYLTASKPGPRILAIFCAIQVVLHSSALSEQGRRLLGADVRALLVEGVAGQYLLGSHLQPSVFGVFLVLSIAAFAGGSPKKAVCLASLASIFHFTYIFSTLLLGGTYAILVSRQSRRAAVELLLLLLVLNIPSAIYTARHFGPTTAEVFRLAQNVVAHHRIPHHCEFECWFDVITVIKLDWVVLALYLSRGTRLCPVLAISLLASLVLTVLQVISRSDGLALLFPWRPSVYLVPIATTVVVTRCLEGAAQRLSRSSLGRIGALRSLPAAASVLFALLAGHHGLERTATEAKEREHSDFGRMMAFVRDQGPRGATYLLPIVSIDHEMQNFRTGSGMPAFVDFKSHPYRDVEVIEWANRVQTAEEFYRGLKLGNPPKSAQVTHLMRAGVTHAVWPRTTGDPKVELPFLYENDTYLVLELAPVVPREADRR